MLVSLVAVAGELVPTGITKCPVLSIRYLALTQPEPPGDPDPAHRLLIVVSVFRTHHELTRRYPHIGAAIWAGDRLARRAALFRPPQRGRAEVRGHTLVGGRPGLVRGLPIGIPGGCPDAPHERRQCDGQSAPQQGAGPSGTPASRGRLRRGVGRWCRSRDGGGAVGRSRLRGLWLNYRRLVTLPAGHDLAQLRRGTPLRGVAAQAAPQGRPPRGGDAAWDAGGPGNQIPHELRAGRACVGALACEALQEDDPEGVHIARPADLAVEDLRSGVQQAVRGSACRRHPAARRSGQAEARQLPPPIDLQDVARLQIPVDNALAVDMGQSGGYLLRHAADSSLIGRPSGPGEVGKGPLRRLGDDVVAPREVPILRNPTMQVGDDVRVPQPNQPPSLCQQASAQARLRAGDQMHRHGPHVFAVQYLMGLEHARQRPAAHVAGQRVSAVDRRANELIRVSDQHREISPLPPAFTILIVASGGQPGKVRSQPSGKDAWQRPRSGRHAGSAGKSRT